MDQPHSLEFQQSSQMSHQSNLFKQVVPIQNLKNLKQKSCSKLNELNERQVKRGMWIVKLKRLDISKLS